MKKLKFSVQKIGKYLREVSVVVIGVAITLSVSYWITNRTEKNDVALYLEAIKIEMEENIKSLDKEAGDMEYWNSYGHFLTSQNKKSISPDSIKSYDHQGFSSFREIAFQTSAFEMFKMSGTMRLIDDKELLKSIWTVYRNLESAKWSVNSYYEIKKEYMEKEIPFILEGTPISIPLYDFFMIYSNHGADHNCRKVSGELQETIAKLEKSKYIK